MKKLRKMFAIVFMATMMTVSASFAGMAETAVETISVENNDSAEENTSDVSDSNEGVSDSSVSDPVSDSQSNGSFETTDKTVDENDSVEFDQADAPEVEKEKAEEVQTTVSSGAVVEVTGQDEVSVSVDEIVVEKSESNVIISAESETVVNTPADNSCLVSEKTPVLENSVQFETTSKVVEGVDVVEFDNEPIKNEVTVTPGVPEEDVPTDVPPVVEPPEPEKPEPEKPQPEVPVTPEVPTTPEPEVPVTPEPEKPAPEQPHTDHDNDHDDHDDYDDHVNDTVTVFSVPVSVVPEFVNEPSPHLAETPVFVDEPAPSTLPKTGDTTPISGYVFVLSLVALIIIRLHQETGKFLGQMKRFQHTLATRRSCGLKAQRQRGMFLQSLKDCKTVILYRLDTGLSLATHHIIRLSAMRRRVTKHGLMELGYRDWYRNPGYAVPKMIARLTGITDGFMTRQLRGIAIMYSTIYSWRSCLTK